MASIRSKREFYRLWEAGCLGNRTLIFHSVEDALAHRPPLDKIGFREIRPAGAGAGAWTLVPAWQAMTTADAWTLAGRKFIMDEPCSALYTATMQGEVCRTIRGLESFLAVGYGLPPMRQTMREGRHQSYGYVATKVLLDEHMDPSSRDDLDALLELYDGHTIEFTCFDVNVGNIPGRNTIFWETRMY